MAAEAVVMIMGIESIPDREWTAIFCVADILKLWL
jgi:hypothetical protein